MYSLLLCISFVSFYCFYMASAKLKITASDGASRYLILHPTISRTLGYTLLFLSWIIFANLQGLGSGSFLTIVYFMAFGSMIVLLKPYTYLRLWHLILITVIFSGIEIYFFDINIMPANKKHLSSPGQRILKITAGFIGGYAVMLSFHTILTLIFPKGDVVATAIFSGYILWAILLLFAFLARNGWKIWGIYILLTLLFAIPYLLR